jgi:hypothetical protein
MTSGRILHRTLRALAVGSTLVVTLGLAAGPASAAPTSATTALGPFT